MRKQLTVFSLLVFLFASTPPHQSHAQADCGGVTPAGAALSCTKSSGGATLTITDGSPTEVTDATAITVNAAAAGADAAFSATGSVIKTTSTDGSTIDVGGAQGATFILDGAARADKDGRRGTVAVVKAGTGDAVVGIHNGSVINIDGVGTGNGIYISSQSGKAVAEFSGKSRIEVYPLPKSIDIPIYEHAILAGGVIIPLNNVTKKIIEVEKVEIYDYDFRVAGETKGIEMETQAGDIELSFLGIYSGIYPYVGGMRDLASDTKAATATSVSGDITVNLTDQAEIVASSVGDSYGLAAVTGGAGSIEINLLNGVSTIVGRNGVIANTVDGDIDITLSSGLIEGRGRGQLNSAYTEAYGISTSIADQAGIGVDATSINGDINITGDTGSVIYAGGRGGVAINAKTAGTLTITSPEARGLSVFATERDSQAIVARTVAIEGAQIWTEGDNSNSVVVASLLEIYGGSKVWAEGASSSAINATSGTLTIESRDGAGEVWTTADSVSTAGITTEVTIHGIKLWANGATTDALATTATGTVTLNGASVWAEGADSNAITAQDVLLSGATAGANSATGGGGIVATGTVKVFNGSNVWTHGAAKSAITGADISISGSNVWSTGDSPMNPVITETGRTSLAITDGSKVWSNGAGTFVITSFDEGFDLNGVSVWSEGDESITIQAATAVNVVNGAVVGANGADSNAIKIQSGGDVTINGSKVWAVREGVITAGGVSITNGSEVWATGTSGTGTAVKGGTVHISGSKVWSAHAGNPAVGAIVGAVNVVGGSFIALNGAGANAVDAVDAGTGGAGAADLSAVVLAVNDSTVMAVAGSSGISAVGTRVVGGVHVIVSGSTIESAGGRAAQVQAHKGVATLDIVNSSLTAVAGTGSAVDVISTYVATTPGTELGVRVYLADNANISTKTSGASALSVDAIGSTERTEITLVGNSSIVSSAGNAVSVSIFGRVVVQINGTSGIIGSGTGVNITGGDNTDFFLNASVDSRIEAAGGSGVVSQMVNGETKIIISDKSRVSYAGSGGDTIKATSVDGAIGLYVNGAAAAADAPLMNPDSAYVSSGQSNTNTVRLQTRNGSTTVRLQGGAQVIAGFPQYGTAARAIHANSADGPINIALGGTSQVAMLGHFVADAIVAETRNGDISFSMSGDSRLSVIPDRSSAFRGVSSGSGDVAITVSGQAKAWAVQKQSHALYGVSGSGNVSVSQSSMGTAVYTVGVDSTAIQASAGGNASIETSGTLFVNGDRSTAAHANSKNANARVDIIFRTPSGGTPAVRYANGLRSKFAVAESAGADATVNSYHSSSSDVTHVISLPGGQAEGLNATTTGAPRTTSAGASAVGLWDIEAKVRLGGRTLVNASGTGAKAIIARADTGYANVIIDSDSAVYANGTDATPGIGIDASTANGGAFVWVDGTVNVTGGVAIKMSAGAKDAGWAQTNPSLVYDKREVTVNATGKVYGDIDTSAVVGGASVTIAAGGTYDGTNVTTSSRRSASSGGDGRFRLGSAGTAEFAGTEPEKSGGGSLNFGDSDGDTLTVNGTLVIRSGETINGLEKISFGANSTLVIMADPESVAGNPLIDLEGTITAEDVEGFNVEVEVPGTHVTEYTIFEAESLPEGEERQEVADRLSAEIGERISVETDENGNLFLIATSHKDTSLDVYDALIQSAYRSDRNFADKLARGCGISGAASDEISGEFWTGGCVWATSGGRYTRHTSAIQYDEDVYSFTGGFSAPFSGVLVSIAGGYEISDIDASSETETAADTKGLGKASGDATRFMGGIFAEALVDEFVLDGNLRYGSTSWEATRTAGNSYSADVDATVFGGEIGAARPFLMGEFAFFPRVAVGASQITADKFVETSLTTGTGAADAAMDAFGVDEISELLVYVSPSIEARSPLNETINMWIRTGADIQVLNPESEIEGRLERDNVPVDGTMDRVMFTYGAGFEYSPYEKFNVSFEYGGGVSSSVDTFVQQFRGGVNYRF